MYSLVLLTAMTTTTAAPAWGGRAGHEDLCGSYAPYACYAAPGSFATYGCYAPYAGYAPYACYASYACTGCPPISPTPPGAFRGQGLQGSAEDHPDRNRSQRSGY